MREGDIYALCPLLPDKWSPPPTLIPALSVSIVAKVAAVEDDPEISDQTKTLAQQQLAWMSEIDAQVPTQVETSVGDPPADVYLRPSKPGRVPKLQGPFDLDLAPEESEDDPENLLTDIFFIGPKIDSEELMFGEEDELEMDDVDQEGLSLGVLCTLANTGRLSIYLDLDGVEAQWLPKTKSKAFRLLDEIDPPSLLTFEVVDTLRDSEAWEGNWPVFSQDVTSRYIFYVTDTSTVSSISLTPWVFRLENELKDTSVNADFRIDLLTRGDKSSCQRLHTQPGLEKSAPLAAGALVSDPDLGYFLLTATPYGPISLTFQAPDTQNDLPRAQSESRSDTDEGTSEGPLVLCEPRPVYEPAHEFDEGSAIPAFLARLGHSKYKRLLSEEVRLSPATLQIMTDAHKVISEETHRIGTAAAEVFRRCER
jgi:nucleoporin NUP82